MFEDKAWYYVWAIILTAVYLLVYVVHAKFGKPSEYRMKFDSAYIWDSIIYGIILIIFGFIAAWAGNTHMIALYIGGPIAIFVPVVLLAIID